MRSWIFVIGAAAMGVASIVGFHFAIVRAEQRVMSLAETPGAEADARLPEAQWPLRCNALAAPRTRPCPPRPQHGKPAPPVLPIFIF